MTIFSQNPIACPESKIGYDQTLSKGALEIPDRQWVFPGMAIPGG